MSQFQFAEENCHAPHFCRTAGCEIYWAIRACALSQIPSPSISSIHEWRVITTCTIIKNTNSTYKPTFEVASSPSLATQTRRSRSRWLWDNQLGLCRNILALISKLPSAELSLLNSTPLLNIRGAYWLFAWCYTEKAEIPVYSIFKVQ
jgi:hypothetical protein